MFDDINNDGLDDLLVGAPLYFDKVLDGGAVYIYYGVRNVSPNLLAKWIFCLKIFSRCQKWVFLMQKCILMIVSRCVRRYCRRL